MLFFGGGSILEGSLFIIFINIACMYLQFTAKYFTPRTVETYNYHCTLLDSPLFKEHSVTYGINYCSTLNDIDNFHIVKQMPQDVMHVLLEGVVPYEVRLMLVYFIAERKLFTCELLNERIDCFHIPVMKAKTGHHL